MGQAEEFKEDVYNRVKSDIPKVDEQETKRRVEERLKKHLETTANKAFETAKDRVEAELTPFAAARLRYTNTKVERDNKNKQKFHNLASKIIQSNYCYIMIIDKKQLLMRRRDMYDNVVKRITEPQTKDKPHISDVLIEKQFLKQTNQKIRINIKQLNITIMKETTRHINLIIHN